MAHICRLNGVNIPLTATEFRILEHLLLQPELIHTRARLIDAVWGNYSQVSDRTLDSHIRNLRQKLTEQGCLDAIETVHGVGIRMRKIL